MAREFDNKVLNETIVNVVKQVFKKMLHVEPTADPVAVEKDLIEFDSRMRVFPMEKFNGPVYVAFVNFYLTQKDLENNHAVGAFVFFIKDDMAEKLVKALGRSMKEGEDDDALMDSVGEFCNVLAGGVKDALSALGYAEMFVSSPYKYKNSVPEGVPFDYELYQKQEISFSFWNQKCVVVETCMGYVPQKGR